MEVGSKVSTTFDALLLWAMANEDFVEWRTKATQLFDVFLLRYWDSDACDLLKITNSNLCNAPHIHSCFKQHNKLHFMLCHIYVIHIHYVFQVQDLSPRRRRDWCRDFSWKPSFVWVTFQYGFKKIICSWYIVPIFQISVSNPYSNNSSRNQWRILIRHKLRSSLSAGNLEKRDSVHRRRQT